VALYPAELRVHLTLPSPSDLRGSTDSDVFKRAFSYEHLIAPVGLRAYVLFRLNALKTAYAVLTRKFRALGRHVGGHLNL
jgi:hypothetical protein